MEDKMDRNRKKDRTPTNVRAGVGVEGIRVGASPINHGNFRQQHRHRRRCRVDGFVKGEHQQAGHVVDVDAQQGRQYHIGVFKNGHVQPWQGGVGGNVLKCVVDAVQGCLEQEEQRQKSNKDKSIEVEQRLVHWGKKKK